MSAKEVIIRLKTEDKKYQQNFLVYEDFGVAEEDPVILKCINELKDSIKEELPDAELSITIKLTT